jgi:hypothetical protein
MVPKVIWAAMESEMETLIVKNAWVVLNREETMHVLPSVWVFKCKRFPDRLVRKLKAQFCVQGNCQINGIDVFDTFAPVVSWQTPVVSWQTVQLLLIFSVVLALATMQVDYTAAFVQAELGEHELVYVEMPRGFKEGREILRLKRALYRLKQSPKTLFEHLQSKLMDECGFKQSPNDPCLFYTDNAWSVLSMLLDDCLFFSPSKEGIKDIFVKMVASGLDFNEESNGAGFLGVLLGVLENKSIELTQTRLIDQIIAVMGLEDSNIVMTPAEYGRLPKDKLGTEAQESWSYRSALLGMMLYLCNTA